MTKLKMRDKAKSETRLPTASILANPMLYVCVSPRSVSLRIAECVTCVWAKQALLQGRLLCDGFVCLANVLALCCWLSLFK